MIGHTASVNRRAPVALLLVLAACSTDETTPREEEEELPDCQIEVDFSGEHEGSIEAEPAIACAVPFAGDTGLTMDFVPGGDLTAFEVDVAEVTLGATGTFPASATVRLADDRYFISEGCEVTLSEHREVDRDEAERDERTAAVLVVGEGRCSAPARSPVEGISGAVEIGAFSFRFPGRWFR